MSPENLKEPHPIWLNVPYRDREAAKRLGALWDPERKRWWVEPTIYNALKRDYQNTNWLTKP